MQLSKRPNINSKESLEQLKLNVEEYGNQPKVFPKPSQSNTAYNFKKD